MFKRLISSLFRLQSFDRESRKPKELNDTSFSFGTSLRSNEFCVRIVHAGGREEFYRNAVPVSHLMKKYPGMCIAWPEVFKNPHESVLSAKELLLPGRKYYVVPETTLKKLKRRHNSKMTKSRRASIERGESLSLTAVSDDSMVESDESGCSAKDYYVSKERWSRCLLIKHIRSNKQFLPPIPKSKSWRGSDWEPSLIPVLELSP